jgi:hypothetical protein
MIAPVSAQPVGSVTPALFTNALGAVDNGGLLLVNETMLLPSAHIAFSRYFAGIKMAEPATLAK